MHSIKPPNCPLFSSEVFMADKIDPKRLSDLDDRLNAKKNVPLKVRFSMKTIIQVLKWVGGWLLSWLWGCSWGLV